MLKNISLGTYYPGNSILHRVQSRTKLLALLWIAVWLVIAEQRRWHFAPFIASICLVCIGAVLAGVPLREMGRRMWFLIAITALGSIFTPFTQEGDVRALYTIAPLITSYGVVRDVILACGGVLLLLLLTALLPVAPLRKLWQMQWLKRMRFTFIVLVGIFAICFWLVTGPSSSHPFAIGPFVLTYGGVWLTVSVSIALLTLYAFSLLLTMATTPVSLIEGLTLLLSPLRRFRLPVDDFALMALLALRFVPTLFEEMEQLIKAQTARGADLSAGTARERLQSLTMLFVPLMRGVLRRATELATALDARGYEVSGEQTLLHESSLTIRDYVLLVVVGLVTIGALFL